MSAGKIVAGFLVVAVIVVIVLAATGQFKGSSDSSSTNSSSSDSSSTNSPPTDDSKITTNVSPALDVKNVKYIVIKKDSTGGIPAVPDYVEYDPNGGAKSINLADILAYSGTKLLTASDYEKLVLTPGDNTNPDRILNVITDNDPWTMSSTWDPNVNVHTMELTLKNPQQITRVDIVNRVDCCWGRLYNSKLILLDANRQVLYTTDLMNVNRTQELQIAY